MKYEEELMEEAKKVKGLRKHLEGVLGGSWDNGEQYEMFELVDLKVDPDSGAAAYIIHESFGHTYGGSVTGLTLEPSLAVVVGVFRDGEVETLRENVHGVRRGDGPDSCASPEKAYSGISRFDVGDLGVVVQVAAKPLWEEPVFREYGFALEAKKPLLRRLGERLGICEVERKYNPAEDTPLYSLADIKALAGRLK